MAEPSRVQGTHPQAANTDTERADPSAIAAWGHELALEAVGRFRAWSAPGATLGPRELDAMRSMAAQLRHMATAAANARDAQQRLF